MSAKNDLCKHLMWCLSLAAMLCIPIWIPSMSPAIDEDHIRDIYTTAAFLRASFSLLNRIHSTCSEELGRPENKDLKGFVDKLARVKQTIDDKGKIAGELLAVCRGTTCKLIWHRTHMRCMAVLCPQCCCCSDNFSLVDAVCLKLRFNYAL